MKNIDKNSISVLSVIVALVIFISSCKTEKIVPNSEAAKDITGNWQVIKATRNGADITSLVDFTQ
ncbi:MAG: DUF5004 domain-containing protein, partial [Sphingobacteriaceae bacterium]